MLDFLFGHLLGVLGLDTPAMEKVKDTIVHV